MALLEINSISKHYSGHTALDDVSFSVDAGTIFGLLGPNGAGKTTLIRIINQIIMPDTGQILLNGEKLKQSHIRQIGYLPEERGLYKKMKVGEQLLYLGRLKGLEKQPLKKLINNWLDRLDLMAWRGKNVEDLSKGMQQKVQFIATVLHEPKLIILDEPFSGFDPVNANLIKDEILRLRDSGSTILLSSHRMESVEQLCDSLVMINKSKKVLEGTTQGIRAKYRKQQYYLTTATPPPAIAGLEVLSHTTTTDGHTRSHVVLEQLTTNALLGQLLPQTSVYGLEEDLPSIQDIFIDIVGPQPQETPEAV